MLAPSCPAVLGVRGSSDSMEREMTSELRDRRLENPADDAPFDHEHLRRHVLRVAAGLPRCVPRSLVEAEQLALPVLDLSHRRVPCGRERSSVLGAALRQHQGVIR